MTRKLHVAISAVVAFLFTIVTVAIGQETSPKQIVLDDLQTALDNEFNARSRYRAFAEKAIDEGYGEVASLFRAASPSGSMHAVHFMARTQARGATPKVARSSARSTRTT